MDLVTIFEGSFFRNGPLKILATHYIVYMCNYVAAMYACKHIVAMYKYCIAICVWLAV